MWKDDLTKSIEEYNSKKLESLDFEEECVSEILEEYSNQDVITKTKEKKDNSIAIFLVLLLFISGIIVAFLVSPKDKDVNIEDLESIQSQSIEYSSEDVILQDNIEYNNLNPGTKYTIKTSVVSKKTGEVVSDKVSSFIPEDSNGNIEVELKIPEGEEEYTIYESLE